ncbi:MAG: hypothetical protein M1832_002821 [Thelocarpon impressellum]|nr:MAG: hypothetical protein M1832_002821 [Thelocarpon impressellum]
MARTARGLQQALGCVHCASTPARHGFIPLSRPFTTSLTHQKHGSLATFAPTSSPELDALLDTFRSKVFLPAHLLRPQRALVYRPRNAALLRSDEPVTVDLGSAQGVPLEPLDRLRDEPPTRKTFARMLALMRDLPEAWDNLPAFLEELRIAKRRLTAAQREKTVRCAAEAGRMDVVLECVKRAARTGLVIQDLPLAREVFWGAYAAALRASWSDEAVLRKSLGQAEALSTLLEEDAHCGSRPPSSRSDPRARPEISGVLLALSGALYAKAPDAALKNRVATHARRLRATWPNADFSAAADAGPGWSVANQRLLVWTPVLRGVRGALSVLDEMSEAGKEETEEVRKWLREAALPSLEEVVEADTRAAAEGVSGEGKRRGLVWAEDLQTL